MEIRNALIPAAGRGSRLDSAYTIKPLVRLEGIPLIGWNILRLHNLGIERFTIITGYRGGLLQDRLEQLFPDLKLRFVNNENWRAGMGLSVLSGKGSVESPFVLTMSDHLYDPAVFQTLIEDESAPVKLAVDHKLHDVYDLDDATRVNVDNGALNEIGKGLSQYNGVDTGLFLGGDQLFDALEVAREEKGDDLTLSDGIRHLIETEGVDSVDIGDAHWIDVDTPGALVRASEFVDATEVPWEPSETTVSEVRSDPPEQRSEESESESIPGHHFTTEEEQLTEVFVERGLLEAGTIPSLIPEERRESPHVLITDERVYELFGETLEKQLREAGIDLQVLVTEEGEAGKSLDNYQELIGLIFDRGIDAGSMVLNLGGGVICNVGGFIASTLYRGIGLIHIPTTLMAQNDAAIGIKQGLNEERGKNLVGSYYPPDRIVVDPTLLLELDDWLLSDGISESLKHGLGQDRELYEFFMNHDGDLRDVDFLHRAVERNIELKIELMNRDPKEKDVALVLQYGHTVGHAVEYLSSYRLGHGQSIAIGMVAAAEIGRSLGLVPDETVDQHRELIGQYDLPTDIPENISAEDVIEALRYNKRYRGDETRFVFVSDIGTIHGEDGQYQFPVSDEQIHEGLQSCTGGPPLSTLQPT